MNHHLTSVVELQNDHLGHVAGVIRPEDEGSNGRLVVTQIGDDEGVSGCVEHVLGSMSWLPC